MPITLVASAKRQSNADAPYNTDAITSTGASLIAAFWHDVAANTTISDSKGNSFTPAAAAYNNTMAGNLRTNYVGSATPAVGSGHTVTLPQFFSGGVIVAFAGTHATPLDGESSQVELSTNTQLFTGSVTPTVGGCLCLTVLASDTDLGTITVPTGYTLLQSPAASGLHYVAVAYKIKGGADTTAENPQWQWTTSTRATAKLAVFKPAAGGGGSTQDLAGAATGSATAGGAASVTKPLAGGASGSAQATGNFPVQIITEPFNNGTGAGGDLPNTTIPKVTFLRASDMAQLYTWTNVITGSDSRLRLTFPGIVAGQLGYLASGDGTTLNYGIEPVTPA